jgi:hypothetical protein
MTERLTSEQAASALQRLSESLLVNDIKEWPASTLNNYFVQATSQHRHDQVIRSVAGIIENIASKTPNRMISAEQLQTWHESFSGLNPQSAFKTVFADFLPISIQYTSDNVQQKLGNRRHDMFDAARDPHIIAHAAGNVIEVDELSDEITSRNQLGELYHPLDFVQDPELVSQGSQLVVGELTRLGQRNVKSKLTFANQDMMVYRVDFQGPEGQGSFSIPIELQDGQLTIPTDFGTEQTGYPLTQAGLKRYFTDKHAQSEMRERVAGQRIRDIYAGDVRAIEDAGTIEISEDQLDDEQQIALPNELHDVEAILTEAVSRKESRYANDTINTALSSLQQQLYRLGFKNANVRFAGDTRANALRFVAQLKTAKGQVEIKVPVEIDQDTALMPAVFIGNNDGVYDFSPQGFSAYLNAGQANAAIRHSSSLVDMTYNELQKTIHQAAVSDKADVAAEALNIIADKFGSEAHTNAVSDYQKALTSIQADHQAQCQGCSFFKSARRQNAPYANDHCLLLNIACNKVIKTASGIGPGHCLRSEPNFVAQYDDSYKGMLNTSQISLT